MAKIVLAITGENANRILDVQSQRFLDFMAPLGFEGRVLSMLSPDFGAKLQAALQEQVAFAWGYAGVGSRIAINGRSIWEITQTPFVSVLADAPYIMPLNHRAGTPWVVNAYVYREWLDFQQAYIAAPQLSTLIPHGVLPNVQQDRLPWSKRPRRMLYVKTGGDPAKRRATWSAWPARLRPVLEDCADALAALPPGPILPVLRGCLEAHDILLDRWRPMFFGLAHELDDYVRTLRSSAMARALLPLPVDIVGGGWDHLRDLPGRARFHEAVSAADLDELYAETQMVVNVTPNLASGAHERVLRGLAAGCCIVSDSNAHARDTLVGLEPYQGVEWNAPDLPDRLASLFHHLDVGQPAIDAAGRFVAERYDPTAFVTRLAELAQVARLQPVFAQYELAAA